jgi:UDP-4-amino-4,6-dideoxy-N-acetyl-beta-L-altrosamine N-acetyltransferase
MWIFKDYKLLNEDEHKKLLQIRNEKSIREASKNKEIITLKNHLAWVKKLENDKKYFALFVDGKIVGGLNFSIDKETIKEWGIFFTKDTKPLISLIATYTFIEYMFKKVDMLYSEVSKKNTQALRFNEYFKLKVYDEDKEFYKLKLSKDSWEKNKKDFKTLQKQKERLDYKFLEKK